MKDYFVIDPRTWERRTTQEYLVVFSTQVGSIHDLLIGAADFLEEIDTKTSAIEAIELGVDILASYRRELRLFIDGPLPELGMIS